MRLRIHQISVDLDYRDADVLSEVARRLDCRDDALDRLVILRRSVDARGRDRKPRFVLSVEVDVRDDVGPVLVPGRVVEAHSPEPAALPRRIASMRRRPIVVGAGPAGLLAALTLAEAGANPLLIDRGAEVELRGRQVGAFWGGGVLDPESNVLYGEGGAGLFSDGKLTSRSKDRGAICRLFEVLVDCGASPDILIDAEPHLGSDVLLHLIPALRERILEAGADIHFGTRLVDVHVDNGAVRGVAVTQDEGAPEEIETDLCVLATGHSARDVYSLLAEADVPLQPKAFAVGVRIEMPQRLIDRAQYGRWAKHPKLESAGFRLTRKAGATARACYSFCTCPGGVVIACASSAGMLTTNGMSYSGRAKPFGNAALLVPVGPDDFGIGAEHDPLVGVEVQMALERAAFVAGGADYGLPAQPLTDFLAGRRSSGIPDGRSCARAVPADMAELLPDGVVRTLRRSLPLMLREINGVRLEDVLLYGAETRSSSPVRIARDPQTGEAVDVKGLYPAGEGSGHAGGIVSSALDGIAAARSILAAALTPC